jgi:cytochrome c
MNFSAKLVALGFVLLAQLAPASAAQPGSAAEAVAMVKRAAAFLQSQGRDEAFRRFNDPAGGFAERDLYIAVVDPDGTMLAHGGNRRLIGKSLADLKDADGKPFIRALLATAQKQGGGWVDYKWPNPVSGQIESKSTYVEKAGGLAIMCGIYRQ